MRTVTQLIVKQRIKTEISHEQNVGAQTYKRSCIAVLNVLSYNAIKMGTATLVTTTTLSQNIQLRKRAYLKRRYVVIVHVTGPQSNISKCCNKVFSVSQKPILFSRCSLL